MIPRIIRAVSGVLLVLQCIVLIAFFGILPLLGFGACPVNGSSADSIYKNGSLAFVREVSASDLSEGDIAVYYKGKTAVGSQVTANDNAASTVTVKAKSGSASISYAKISGKGSSFSVPLLGKYAQWLVAGKGLLTSVIIMGVTSLIFGVSAFLVRDKD